MTAIDGAVLVALAGWALWSESLRTRRTIVLLLVTAVAYFLAVQLLPNTLAFASRAVLVGAVVWLLLLHTEFFVDRSDGEQFAVEYADYLRRVRDLAADRKAGISTPSEFTQALRELITEGATLTPLDPEWAALKRSTTQHLQSQLSRYEQAMAGLPISDAVLQAGEREMAEIEARYTQLIERTQRRV